MSIPKYHSLDYFVVELRSLVFASQAQVAHELNFVRTTITKYETGKLRPDVGYLAFLAQAYVSRLEKEGEPTIDMKEELRKELNVAIEANYDRVKKFSTWNEISLSAQAYQETRSKSKKADTDAIQSSSSSNHNFLAEFQNEPDNIFVGRESLLTEILDVLRDPNGNPAVAIDGMGGIGKSALAREVADHCQNEHLFEVIIWESATRDIFVSEILQKSGLTFEGIINDIGNKLGIPNIAKTPLPERINQIQTLLRRRRVLVVLDNLETAQESQESIVEQLLPLLSPSRVLLTSRQRFMGSFCKIHLEGLDTDSAGKLIRQLIETRKIHWLQKIKSGELEQIAKTTGGSPLAIRLVVSLAEAISLQETLNHLKKVQPLRNDADQDEYISFYRLIFFPLWERLSEMSQNLLLAMATFRPQIGGSLKAIRAISDIPEYELNRCIYELWRFSFLESDRLSKERYYLHTLTWYFVQSDLLDRLKK